MCPSVNRRRISTYLGVYTLYDRVSGRVVHGVKPGPEPYLRQTEEKELGGYLKYCAEDGNGKTRRDVLCIVESAVNESGKLRSIHVSDGWWRRFKERPGDLSLRQGDSTAHVRDGRHEPGDN